MSLGTIAAIVTVLLITILVPLGIMLCLHKRGSPWNAFLIGAGTFVLFALVLESLLHNLVLRSAAGAVLQGNIWLYALYGGLAAGLFEETGRLLAFQFALRKRRDRLTALAYGIGHGGAEAFLLVGLTMISNLVLGLLYPDAGTAPSELAPAMELLFSTPAASFLLGGLERLTAMTLHVALSVLVFASVRTARRWLFPAAVLTHAAVDFAVVIANTCLPLAATEALILLLTLPVVAWAARIYKNLPQKAENP